MLFHSYDFIAYLTMCCFLESGELFNCVFYMCKHQCFGKGYEYTKSINMLKSEGETRLYWLEEMQIVRWDREREIQENT